MNSNGARTILVENASRFARDLAVQISGYELLKQKGYELIAFDCPTHFLEDTPTATMVRNILGAVSQFEKANLVEKLRVARDRMREETTDASQVMRPVSSSRTDSVSPLRLPDLV